MKRSASLLALLLILCSVLVTLPKIASVETSSTMWSQTYGGADYDSVEAVIQTSDGGYALAGRTKSFGEGSYEFWLIKTDSLGTAEWNKTYGGGNAESIVQTSDGGYVIAGSTGGMLSSHALLIKTDSAGTMQWNRTHGGTGS